MSSIGPWESVGGDIKFLRLKQRGVAGLVTDGSVRDTGALLGYGFPVFSHSTTANQGPAAMQPWAVDDVVMVGGVAVRPGDYLVGDQDGVVVIPSTMAEDVLRLAHEREEVEDVIKEELTANPVTRTPSPLPPATPPPPSTLKQIQHTLCDVISTFGTGTTRKILPVPKAGC